MPDENSANFAPLVSREQSGNALRHALGLFVGRGRRYSVKELSNATGVKDRMIECAKLDPANIDYRPLPDWAIASIGKFLGAPFLAKWLELAAVVPIDAGELDIDALAAAAADFAADYARARSPVSPGGIEIVDEERGPLTDKAANLRG